MAQAPSTLFEFGHGPIAAGRKISITVLQLRRLAQNLEHLPCVILPISSTMEMPSGLESRAGQGHKRRLDETAFMVSFFRPWVREKDPNGGQALGRYHMLQHLDGIVLNDAQVVTVVLFDAS